MSEHSDTVPAPSVDAAPTLEAVLLAGLTAEGDESPAFSIFGDAYRELDALTVLLALDLDGEPLDRPAMVVMLEGIERRMRAGLTLLLRERGREDVEITKDAAPGGEP